MTPRSELVDTSCDYINKGLIVRIVCFVLLIVAISCYSVRVYSAGDESKEGGIDVTPQVGGHLAPEDSV